MELFVSLPSSGDTIVKASEFWGYGCVASDGKGFIKAGDGPVPSKWTENTAVAFVLEEPAHINGQDMKAGAVVMMDPRVLIAEAGKEGVIWEPRMLRGGLHPKWVREWLHDHPEWPYETMKERLKANEARGMELRQEIAQLAVKLLGLGPGEPTHFPAPTSERSADVFDWQVRLLDAVNRIRSNPGFLRAIAANMGLPSREIEWLWQIRSTVAEKGEPFYVSGEITRLLISASREIPPWTLTLESLPCPIGNLWFSAHPRFTVVSPDEEESKQADLLGIGWAVCWWAGEGDKRFMCATEAAAKAVSSMFGPMVVLFGYLAPDNSPGVFTAPIEIIWQVGRTSANPWPYGTPLIDPGDVPQVPPLFAATMAFINQRLLVHHHDHPDRATRRRMEAKLQIEPLVRVITLRKSESSRRDAEEGDPVEWSCRWLVSGHWRQQPYPSKGITQPIWIAPYIKGPDGKPLKPTRGRVFAVIR